MIASSVLPGRALAAGSMFLMIGTALALGGKAVAEIKDRTGHVIGKAELLSASGGVLIRVKLKELPPGTHGLRLHEAGKCEGDFASAGEIYNPLGAKHGLLSEDGPAAGDLPNVTADASGNADAEFFSPHIALTREAEEGFLDQDGASILIFERPDDHASEPDGNAGAPIACGVITAQ